jgi:glycosyltransferase involved in cell wall biosynthesis
MYIRLENSMAEVQHHAKIVYISHWFPLSSETFVFYEVEWFYNKGFDISVVSLYGRRDKELSRRLLHCPVPVERLGIFAVARVFAAVLLSIFRNSGKTLEVIKDILFRRWRDWEQQLENTWAGLCGIYLSRRFQEQGVEHIHAAWANGPATAAWVASRLSGIPFSFSCHAGDIYPPDGALAEKARASAFARTIATNNILHLDTFEPEAKDKHHLIYAIRTVPNENRRAEVRMVEPLRLLCIGRLVEMKGFRYAVEAVRELKDRGIQSRLDIAGSGFCERQLKKLAAKLGIRESVHFHTFVTHDRIPDFLCASDIMLMPCIVLSGTGKSDGLPTVIIEGMTYGLPIISTNVAGIGDVIKHGETGLLVPQHDAVALADAVISLLRDRENALRMADAAQKLVQVLFDSERNMLNLAALFDKHALNG